MRKLVFLAALVATTSPAMSASPYVGRWATDEMSCDEAITISEATLEGVENECRFTNIIPGQTNYLVESVCQGEGLPEEERIFAFNFKDGRLLFADENGQVGNYRRCN